MKHQDAFLLIIVLSVILSSCAEPNTITKPIISTETIYTSTITPTITNTHTPTKTPTITPTPTLEVDYSKVDIFNEATWPEKYQRIWDGGWLNSKEADRQDFQQFIEKVRAAFFAKEGMTDEVAKMTAIRPELRSLWGMIDYVETHKDEVVKNQTFIPVTPTELEWMMTDPAYMDNAWSGEVHAWKGEPVNQGTTYVTYFPDHAYFRNNFSSEVFGMPIAGKDGLVVVPRAPFDRITGDLAALGYIGGGKSRINILLMSLVDWNLFYYLAAPAVSFDENMIAPKGSPCPDEGTVNPIVFLTQDLIIDQIQDLYGNKYTIKDVFKFLGKNAMIVFRAHPPNDAAAYALEPKSKDDIATQLRRANPLGEPDNWPWPEK